ncbi:MAG: 23S rRNA (pseudouridine(1915)-N(3))-methyltransferase RlmH [Thermodesulfobacteriota bacterium]
MKIVFLCVGGIKKGYIARGVEEYLKRIGRYSPVEVIEVKEGPAPKGAPRVDVLKREAERIVKKLGKRDFIVALSDTGRVFDSKGFSGFFERILSGGKQRICFIVGGAYGLHPTVVEGADANLSLSAMTMPHELARLVLFEQVYRAFTIMKGEPYSH